MRPASLAPTTASATCLYSVVCVEGDAQPDRSRETDRVHLRLVAKMVSSSASSRTWHF
jgi:hypothetical protein